MNYLKKADLKILLHISLIKKLELLFTMRCLFFELFLAVLWIRIRMDSELLPGSGIIVKDTNPAKYERADK